MPTCGPPPSASGRSGNKSAVSRSFFFAKPERLMRGGIRFARHRGAGWLARFFSLDPCSHSVNCSVYVTSTRQADLLGHQLAMNLRGAYTHLRRRSNQVLARFGMSSDQYVLLAALAEHGEATQQELVRCCFSDTATIGAMVGLLEAKGLVRRTPDPEDGRATRVGLTPAGRRRAAALRRASVPVRAEMAALFNSQEMAALLAFLQRLTGAFRPPGRPRAGAAKSAPKRLSKR